MSHAGDKDFDLDEDLFDFAAVAREADDSASESEEDIEEILASFRDGPPPEDLLDLPSAPAPARAPAAPAPAAAAPRAPEPSAPPQPPVPARPGAPPRPSEPVHELRPARSSSLTKSVLAIALSVTVLNGALAVVMLRGRTSADGPRPEVALESAPDEHGALAAPPHPAKAPLPDPEVVAPVHAHPALDEARSEISRGEYAAARQRVYGLLAIIDRLEDPRRGALEADCQFLIAQSLHLEALARMGGER